MSYVLKLTVNKETSSLSLFKEGEKVSTKEWSEARDMGRQLLEALKEILEEAKVETKEVEVFTVEGDAPENFTSKRIAETVAGVYNFTIAESRRKE